MKTPKEIENFKDKLEPHYETLDHIVDDIIRHKVSEKQFKFFDACRFKLKAIWYILKRIEELDNEYKNYLLLCKSNDALEGLPLTKSKDWSEKYNLFFPFFEAVEFENLLTQGKSCLDVFSKAVGSLYAPGSLPKNLKGLIKILESKSNEKISKLLEFIYHEHKLHGVIIDPISKKGKKSLRDLIIHYERADIFFTIRKDDETHEHILSSGAIVNMRHPEIAKLPNYLVTEIANKVWFLLLGIVENCFRIQFDAQ
jgi:hypothetical protein